MIGEVIKGVLSPISNAYKANQERKTAKETAKAKIEMSKNDNDFKLELTKAEWESLSKSGEGGTWKDEYVTIVITSPVALLFISSIASAYTGNTAYVDSVNAGISSLKNLDIDLSFLMNTVVLAAVSIKGYSVVTR